MDYSQAAQIVGALLILAGFLFSQMNRLDPGSYRYIALNLVGGAILAVLAWQGQRWGFVLLEGTWTVIALGALVMRLQGKDVTAGH